MKSVSYQVIAPYVTTGFFVLGITGGVTLGLTGLFDHDTVMMTGGILSSAVSAGISYRSFHNESLKLEAEIRETTKSLEALVELNNQIRQYLGRRERAALNNLKN